MLNEQLLAVRDRKHRREVLNEFVRIFQGVECLIEIKVRIGNERRYYTSFGNVKIMIIRPEINYFIEYSICSTHISLLYMSKR